MRYFYILALSSILAATPVWAATTKKTNTKNTPKTAMTGIPDGVCVEHAIKVVGDFLKSYEAANPQQLNFRKYACKYNPCTQQYEIARVTGVTGSDWHSSPMWEDKAATLYEFDSVAYNQNNENAQKFDGRDLNKEDIVIVDTQTGYYTVLCGATDPAQERRVYVTNWLQWMNQSTDNVAFCSTLDGPPESIVFWVGEDGLGDNESWCIMRDVSGDHYCTFAYVNTIDKNGNVNTSKGTIVSLNNVGDVCAFKQGSELEYLVDVSHDQQNVCQCQDSNVPFEDCLYCQ